jgi:hypothetical protein
MSGVAACSVCTCACVVPEEQKEGRKKERKGLVEGHVVITRSEILQLWRFPVVILLEVDWKQRNLLGSEGGKMVGIQLFKCAKKKGCYWLLMNILFFECMIPNDGRSVCSCLILWVCIFVVQRFVLCQCISMSDKKFDSHKQVSGKKFLV